MEMVSTSTTLNEQKIQTIQTQDEEARTKRRILKVKPQKPVSAQCIEAETRDEKGESQENDGKRSPYNSNFLHVMRVNKTQDKLGPRKKKPVPRSKVPSAANVMKQDREKLEYQTRVQKEGPCHSRSEKERQKDSAQRLAQISSKDRYIAQVRRQNEQSGHAQSNLQRNSQHPLGSSLHHPSSSHPQSDPIHEPQPIPIYLLPQPEPESSPQPLQLAPSDGSISQPYSQSQPVNHYQNYKQEFQELAVKFGSIKLAGEELEMQVEREVVMRGQGFTSDYQMGNSASLGSYGQQQYQQASLYAVGNSQLANQNIFAPFVNASQANGFRQIQLEPRNLNPLPVFQPGFNPPSQQQNLPPQSNFDMFMKSTPPIPPQTPPINLTPQFRPQFELPQVDLHHQQLIQQQIQKVQFEEYQQQLQQQQLFEAQQRYLQEQYQLYLQEEERRRQQQLQQQLQQQQQSVQQQQLQQQLLLQQQLQFKQQQYEAEQRYLQQQRIIQEQRRIHQQQQQYQLYLQQQEHRRREQQHQRQWALLQKQKEELEMRMYVQSQSRILSQMPRQAQNHVSILKSQIQPQVQQKPKQAEHTKPLSYTPPQQQLRQQANLEAPRQIQPILPKSQPPRPQNQVSIQSKIQVTIEPQPQPQPQPQPYPQMQLQPLRYQHRPPAMLQNGQTFQDFLNQFKVKSHEEHKFQFLKWIFDISLRLRGKHLKYFHLLTINKRSRRLFYPSFFYQKRRKYLLRCGFNEIFNAQLPKTHLLPTFLPFQLLKQSFTDQNSNICYQLSKSTAQFPFTRTLFDMLRCIPLQQSQSQPQSQPSQPQRQSSFNLLILTHPHTLLTHPHQLSTLLSYLTTGSTSPFTDNQTQFIMEQQRENLRIRYRVSFVVVTTVGDVSQAMFAHGYGCDLVLLPRRCEGFSFLEMLRGVGYVDGGLRGLRYGFYCVEGEVEVGDFGAFLIKDYLPNSMVFNEIPLEESQWKSLGKYRLNKLVLDCLLFKPRSPHSFKLIPFPKAISLIKRSLPSLRQYCQYLPQLPPSTLYEAFILYCQSQYRQYSKYVISTRINIPDFSTAISYMSDDGSVSVSVEEMLEGIGKVQPLQLLDGLKMRGEEAEEVVSRVAGAMREEMMGGVVRVNREEVQAEMERVMNGLVQEGEFTVREDGFLDGPIHCLYAINLQLNKLSDRFPKYVFVPPDFCEVKNMYWFAELQQIWNSTKSQIKSNSNKHKIQPKHSKPQPKQQSKQPQSEMQRGLGLFQKSKHTKLTKAEQELMELLTTQEPEVKGDWSEDVKESIRLRKLDREKRIWELEDRIAKEEQKEEKGSRINRLNRQEKRESRRNIDIEEEKDYFLRRSKLKRNHDRMSGEKMYDEQEKDVRGPEKRLYQLFRERKEKEDLKSRREPRDHSIDNGQRKRLRQEHE